LKLKWKVSNKNLTILSNLVVNGNTLVSDLLDDHDFGKEIKIDVSKYKQIFAKNLVTSEGFDRCFRRFMESLEFSDQVKRLVKK
jgi:hypothetical protein